MLSIELCQVHVPKCAVMMDLGSRHCKSHVRKRCTAVESGFRFQQASVSRRLGDKRKGTQPTKVRVEAWVFCAAACDRVGKQDLRSI
eukprot:3236799-Rhodomonas_salina.3